MKIKNHYSVFLLLTVFIVLVLISCKDDNVNDPAGEPPEMPPISTFQMDFSAFTTSFPLAKITNSDSANHSNFAWASLNGVVWQTLVTAGMTVPVAAFAASFNHTPEQLEDGRWRWSYEFTILGGVKHTASLYGSIDNNGVKWEMYITKENIYENFLWYTGQSDVFASEGTWTLYVEPNNPTPWIGIEWERNINDSTGNIKYTNIVPGGSENGGYILYGVTTDTDYDAFYEIYNKGKGNTINIKWNRETHQGRVQDMNHFGNDQWQCWDSNLENIICQ